MEKGKFSFSLILVFTMYVSDQILAREIFCLRTAAMAKVVHFSEIHTGVMWLILEKKEKK